MKIHPASFLLGLGAATLVPLFTRVLRPLAVEVTAAGIGVYQEGRRFLTQQLETFEDIAAEARARRDAIVAAEENGHVDIVDAGDESAADAPAELRARRRPAARGRQEA
jgi:hypothetical protein